VTDKIGAEAIHASVADSVNSLTSRGWGTLPGTQEVIAAGLLNLRGVIDLAARQESGERRSSLEQAGECLDDAIGHVEGLDE
jgi:hypothetical protein